MVLAIVTFALLGPMLIGKDPNAQDLTRTLQPPNAADWLGTDVFGRSMAARLAAGARLSLSLALGAVAAAAAFGTLLGIAAAWRGGWLERVLIALADSVLAVPALLLVLLLAAVAPGEVWPLYFGLSLAFWVEYFRSIRAVAARALKSPQVEASGRLGFGPAYVLRRHIFPEILPFTLTLIPYSIATAVLSLAALGFIGVGLRPPSPELGVMITELLPHYQEAPWLIAGPIAVLMAAVLGLALLSGQSSKS